MNPYKHDCPVMLASESAYRLAMKTARKGGNVVFKCRSVDVLNDAHNTMVGVIRWRGWFGHFVMKSWKITPAYIRHCSGGRIDFMRYDSFDVVGRKVDLEVRA